MLELNRLIIMYYIINNQLNILVELIINFN